MADLEDVIKSGMSVVETLDSLEGMPEQNAHAVAGLTQFVNSYAGTEAKPGEIKDLPKEVKNIISKTHGPMAVRKFPEYIDKNYDKWPVEFSYSVAIPNMEKLGEKYKVATNPPAEFKKIQQDLETLAKGEVPDDMAKARAGSIADKVAEAHAKSSKEEEFNSAEFKSVLTKMYINNKHLLRKSLLNDYAGRAINYVKEHKKEFKEYLKQIASGIGTVAGDIYDKFKDISGIVLGLDGAYRKYQEKNGHAAAPEE